MSYCFKHSLHKHRVVHYTCGAFASSSIEKMPLVERLRLDEVVSSYPELGPTVPDGGYSWFVLLGVVFIQVRSPHVYLNNKVALLFRNQISA